MPFLMYDPNAPQQSGLGGLNTGLNIAMPDLDAMAQQSRARQDAMYQQLMAQQAQDAPRGLDFGQLAMLAEATNQYREARQQQQQQQQTQPTSAPMFYNPGTGQFFRNGMVIDEDDDAGFVALAEAPSPEDGVYAKPGSDDWIGMLPQEVSERLQGIKNPSFGKLMGKNWDIGVSNMKMLTGALMSWAGMEEAGGKVMAAAHREVEKNQPYSKEFTGVLEGRDSLLDWLAGTVAQQGPNVVSTVLSAAAGAAAGSAVAPGAGTIAGGVTGFLGRGAASKAALRLAKQFATKENQKLLVKAAAKYRNGKALDAAEAEIFKKAAMGTAAAASATAANYGMALGDTYNEMIEHGTENRALAAATGIPYAMLDMLPQALAASKILGFGKAFSGGLPTRVGKGVVAGMGLEGLTEGSQKVLTLAAAQQNPFTPENLAQITNEAAAGAAVGSLFGAASGVRSASTKQTDINDPSQPADLLNGNNPAPEAPGAANDATQPAQPANEPLGTSQWQQLPLDLQGGEGIDTSLVNLYDYLQRAPLREQTELFPYSPMEGYVQGDLFAQQPSWPAPGNVQPQTPQVPQAPAGQLSLFDEWNRPTPGALPPAPNPLAQALPPGISGLLPAPGVIQPPGVIQLGDQYNKITEVPYSAPAAPAQPQQLPLPLGSTPRPWSSVQQWSPEVPPALVEPPAPQGRQLEMFRKTGKPTNAAARHAAPAPENKPAPRRQRKAAKAAPAPVVENNPALALALGNAEPAPAPVAEKPKQPKKASSQPTGEANLKSAGTRRRKATSGKQTELFTEEGLPTVTAAKSAGVREQKSGDDTAGMTVEENAELANQQSTAPFSGVVDVNAQRAQEATGEQNAGENKTTRQRATRAPKADKRVQKAAEKKAAEKKTTAPKAARPKPPTVTELLAALTAARSANDIKAIEAASDELAGLTGLGAINQKRVNAAVEQAAAHVAALEEGRAAGPNTRRHTKGTKAAKDGAALWRGISPERRSFEADLRGISVAADPENKQLYHAMDVDPEGAGMFWHTEKETVERGEAVWNALDDKQKEVVKAQMARTLHKDVEDVAENDAMFWHIGKLIMDSAKVNTNAHVVERAIMLAKVREKFGDVRSHGFDLNAIADAFLDVTNADEAAAKAGDKTALDSADDAKQILSSLIKEKVDDWFGLTRADENMDDDVADEVDADEAAARASEQKAKQKTYRDLTEDEKKRYNGLLGELNTYVDDVYKSLGAVAAEEKPARDIVREVWSKTELGKEAAAVQEARAKRAAEVAAQAAQDKKEAAQATKLANTAKRKRITDYIKKKSASSNADTAWSQFAGWAQAEANDKKSPLTQGDADVISAVAKRDKNRPLDDELNTVLKAIALRDDTTTITQVELKAPGEQRIKQLSEAARKKRDPLSDYMRSKATKQADTATQYEEAAKKPSATQSSVAENKSAQAQESVKFSLNPDTAKAFEGMQQYYAERGITIKRVAPQSLEASEKVLVAAFKRAFGVDVVFFTGPVVNGTFFREHPSTIFVNRNANTGIVHVAGHELLHLLRANSPKLYDWFVDEVVRYGVRTRYDLMPGFAEHNARYNALRRAHGFRAYSGDQTREELIADYVGDLMMDKAFLEQLAASNPSRFASFARTLIRLWDALVARLKMLAGYGAEYDTSGVKEFIKDVPPMRALVVDLLNKFSTAANNTSAQVEQDTSSEALASLAPIDTDADLATRATIAGAMNMRYPEGGSGVLGASDLLRTAAGKATNLSAAVSRALNHLQTTNQKALRSEGFAKVYSLIDEMHTFGRSLLSKYHRMMHRTYSPNLFGFKDGVSEAQKERAGELLSHAALHRAGKVNDVVLVEQTAPLLVVDGRGDWSINQTALKDLKKRGYVTAEEFRKGLEITRSDGSTFIFKRNVDEKSNEWAVYNEARQAINEGAVDLLMATVGAAQAEVDTRFTELLNGIAGDTTAHRATMERVHEMLAKLIRSNETVRDGRVYVDDVTSETVEDTIITLGRALFNEGVLYALENNAKAPQEIHEEVNAKTWLRSRDEYEEIVKGLRALHDKLNKGARKTKDGKIDTEKARQWSYQWQAALRDLQLQDQNVRNAELYAKQTILSSYVPFSRWGNEQVGLKAIDVATGKPVQLPGDVRGTLPYFLAEDEAMALDVAEKLNEAFDGEFEIDGRMVRFTAEVSRAKQTRDYTSGASLADVLNFMRRMGVNPAPQQRKRLVEALTAQGSAARHGLKRIGVPGWDKNVVRGVSEHLETVSHLAAKKRFDPQFSATLGNDSLWLGDDDKLERLQRIVDEADTEETRAQAQRDYDAYAYKYLHMKAIGKDNKVTIGGEERATLGVGEDYREEAKRLVSWVQGTANIAESTEDILSGEFGSKLKLATVLMQLGGSIATAVVNLSSVVTHAMPYLSYYNKNRGFGGGYGVGKAVNALWKAANDVKNYKLADPYFLEQVLKKGEWGKYGLTAEEARFLFEQTEQGALQAAQFNALIGTARGKVQSNNMQAAIQAWMAAFSYTEQFNRRVTALAAFRLEQERLKDAGHLSEEHIFNRAAEAAKKAVVESQGEYAMWNRPEMARGNIMQYVFMYKQFVITTIQLMKNMPKQGQLTMLAMLFLCSGLKGLPFADDLMDIIDTICQALGLKVASVEAEATKLLDQMAPGITPYVMRGVLDQWTGATFSTRLGQGDLIPLSGAFKAGADPAREALNFAGPVFSGISGLAGLGAAAVRSGAEAVGLRDDTSDFGEALRKAPIAGVRALADAAAYAKTGDVTNSRGQVIAKGASPLTVAARAAGFYPASATRQNDLTRLMKQQSNYAREISDAYKQAYVKAMKDGDRKRMVEIEQDVRAWNRAAKGTGLEVGTNFKLAARRALKEANKPLGQRTLAAQGKHQRKAAEQLVSALDG